MGPLISEALALLPAVAERYEIICVNDGSTDGTAAVVRELEQAHPEVRLVSHEVNQGYGAALRTGIEASRLDWVFFTDGDRQFRLTDLPSLVDHVHSPGDVIIGYRLKRQDAWHRSLNASLYKMLLVLVLRLSYRDIDCAYKLMPAQMVQKLQLKSSGALISAEILARLRAAGANIREVGVTHYPRTAGQQSGAKLSVILRMFRELLWLSSELRREQAEARRQRQG